MRIPNQLDRDNLYRRGEKRHGSDIRPAPGGSASAWRRIIRLLIVLALVVAVMRQANRREIYDVFFPEPMQTLTSGDPADRSARDGANERAAAKITTPQEKASSGVGTGPDDAASIRSTPLERRSTTDVHSPSTLQVRTAAKLLSPQQRQQILAALIDSPDADIRPTLVDSPPATNPSDRSGLSWWIGATNRGEVVGVLLDTMIQAAADGTVWRAADHQPLTGGLALHRLMAGHAVAGAEPDASVQDGAGTQDSAGTHVDSGASGPGDTSIDDQKGRTDGGGSGRRPGWLSWPLPGAPDPPAAVGVLPLLQQPSVYRGRPVIAEGELARLEPIDAADNPFHIHRYWNLWLRPADGSGRPWLTVVADLPPGLDSLAEQTDGDVSGPLPTVRIHGEYLKRLAYASAAGVQTTPVVVGHVAGIQSNGHPAVAAGLRQWQRTTGQLTSRSPTPSHPQPFSETQVWMLLAVTALAGVGLAAALMWRYSRLLRRSRLRRHPSRVPLPLLWLAVGLSLAAAPAQTSQAASLEDLLGRFSRESLEAIPLPSPDARDGSVASRWPASLRGDLAKLVYRMSRLSEAILRQRHQTASQPPVIGEAEAFAGTIQKVEAVTVPPELADVLEMSQFQRVRLRTETSSNTGGVSDLLVRQLPKAAEPGDRLSGVGLVLRPATSNETGAAGSGAFWVGGAVQWTPAEPTSPSQAVLADAGVDVGGLPALARRSRQPLTAADSDLFFPMIAAADMAADASSAAAEAMRAPTDPISPIELLQSPDDRVGQWVEIKLETVRWTRVAIESPARRQQAGTDAYYQIDAMGDLGDVQLRIEGADGGPVTMENRYPVTIVSADLPDFLRQAAGGDDPTLSPDGANPVTDPVVGMAKVPVTVSGFFYRLWSYQSDFMESRGGDDQFAPLIIAGRVTDRRMSDSDAAGIHWIGMFAAVAVALGIAATFWFGRVTQRGDLEARRRRQEGIQESE